MTDIDWVAGDHLGLRIPAHVDALRAGGADFLTRAFRASGVLGDTDSVAAINGIAECAGGSTGRKFFLTVDYAQHDSGLQRQLFVKFSRDFDDRIRDQGREQLEPEVRLALLSRDPAFPIAVPRCYFADYHGASGTGVLITQRIAFGSGEVEPLYPKCLDHAMPEPLAHYQAIIRALGKLAGTHKSGGIEDSVARHFPYVARRQSLNQPLRYGVEQLLRRLDRLKEFAAAFPRLLPGTVTSSAFIARLARDIPLAVQHEVAIKQCLQSRNEHIALMHWNANVDNAWFWRDHTGQLQCGLIDWGNVGQMNIGLALWGALSAAEPALWSEHLDALLALFVDEFHSAGGPALDSDELKRHILLAAAMMGLSWLMDAPAMIRRELPGLDSDADRFHPAIADSESARTQLLMFTNFLNLWQRHHIGSLLREVAEREPC